MGKRRVWAALIPGPHTSLAERVTRLIQREPVAFQGCVQAALAALAGFGLVHWSSEQVALALALVAAFLALFTRAKVTPMATTTTTPPTKRPNKPPTAPPPTAPRASAG